MVEENFTGSEDLRKKIPFGVIDKMAKTFNTSGAWIGQVLSGKKKGNNLLIQCAIKISAINIDHQAEIDNVLKKYTNESNN